MFKGGLQLRVANNRVNTVVNKREIFHLQAHMKAGIISKKHMDSTYSDISQ